VWNDCLKIAKQHYKINKTELQKLTKAKYPIHSQSIQAVVHEYIWARDAAREARKQGITTARSPYKQKKNFNTKWAKDGFKIYENGKSKMDVSVSLRWYRTRSEQQYVYSNLLNWVKFILSPLYLKTMKESSLQVES
jgi:putative transposase